ncbi:MAG TPA: cation diffusion facilitator family transporter [Conexibacter sp.]|nr:cation diffusion facilitator family transporter [Conexibacter sp.]
MAHAHGHDGHAHGPGGHTHPRSGTDARALTIALTLIVAFMAAEVAAGILAHSLALLSDAGHMLTDAAALALALLALRIARRPPSGAMTYGFGRVEILSAQANGITLVLLGLWIVYEAIRRLIAPPEVHGAIVVVVALAGIVVNLAATFALAGASRESLNVEGSFQHILTDLFAFVATAIAGAIILATGFARADALASLLVAASMLYAGTRLVIASARVFMEAAPAELDPQQIGRTLAAYPGVVEVHDLHVWEVTSGFPALSAYVVVGAGRDCHELRRALQRELTDLYGLRHTTLQVDHEAAPQAPLQIEIAGQAMSAVSPSARRQPEK